MSVYTKCLIELHYSLLLPLLHIFGCEAGVVLPQAQRDAANKDLKEVKEDFARLKVKSLPLCIGQLLLKSMV